MSWIAVIVNKMNLFYWVFWATDVKIFVTIIWIAVIFEDLVETEASADDEENSDSCPHGVVPKLLRCRKLGLGALQLSKVAAHCSIDPDLSYNPDLLPQGSCRCLDALVLDHYPIVAGGVALEGDEHPVGVFAAENAGDVEIVSACGCHSLVHRFISLKSI